MTGLPVFLVELDDGTGFFPHDVTEFVHMPTGVSADRGRQDEFGTVEASRLSLRLDNEDGRFTIGAPTYGVHVDQRIRVTEIVGTTVSKRFTGYVQDWPLTWPTPTAAMATVTVSAFDRLTRLSRRKLRSLVENEIMGCSPVAYYTLGEAEGVTAAGDTSGTGSAPLAAGGTGAAVVFGAAIGSGADDLTAAQFSGGKYLVGPRLTSVPGSRSSLVFFNCISAPSALTTLIGGLSFQNIRMDASGRISAGALTSPLAYADGVTHCAASVFVDNPSSPDDILLYVDGVLVASTNGSGGGNAVLTVGGESSSLGAIPFVGTLAHAAFFHVGLSADDVADIYAAGLTGFVGEASDERLERLGTYAGLTPADLALEPGVLDVPTQQTGGVSPLDAMRQIEQAEGGLLFIDGAGLLTFHNRTHRVLTATGTPALAVSAADVDHDDLTISTDKQYLQNTVTGSRAGGATQTLISQASVNIYDEYAADLPDLLVTTDTEVLARMNWQIGAYDDVAPRMSSVTIDLLTVAQPVQEAVLALELGDRLTVSALPAQSPMATADLIIEGWSERTSSSAWSITFNTAPAELFRAWILGDPVHGVLGSTTRPHF